jgi:hypothetical protein
MIILKRTRDPKNQFSIAEVTVELSNDSTLPDILEEVKNFLMACGYPINFGDNLIIVDEEGNE